jgi:hypothetical protein
VLKRIAHVIRDTETPSWLCSVPHNFGHAAAGTLKADEWRSMATVYLPLAFVSLWGEGTVHPSAQIAADAHQVLDHTMTLFSAVNVACLQTMTTQRQSAYHELITRYVHDLPLLHPKVNLRPNHHMAQHIHEFITLFGPVRSWWCFPFERLIGLLQRLPTNHRFGEYFHFFLSTS